MNNNGEVDFVKIGVRELAELRAEIVRLNKELEEMITIKDIHQRKRYENFERAEKAEIQRDTALDEIARLNKLLQNSRSDFRMVLDRAEKADAERDEQRMLLNAIK